MMKNIAKISYCRNVALVTLRNVPHESGIIGEILTAISEQGINVDMISQTAPLGNAISIAFSISLEAMEQLMPIINGLKPKYPKLHMEMSPGMTKLNFYDPNMESTPGVAAQVFNMFARGNIRVIMITTSIMDISVLISEHDEDAALELCRKSYNLEPLENACT